MLFRSRARRERRARVNRRAGRPLAPGRARGARRHPQAPAQEQVAQERALLRRVPYAALGQAGAQPHGLCHREPLRDLQGPHGLPTTEHSMLPRAAKTTLVINFY